MVGFVTPFIIRIFYPACWKLYYIIWMIWLGAMGFGLSWWHTHQQEAFYRISNHAMTVQGTVQQVEEQANGKRRVTLETVHFLTFPDSEQNAWHRRVCVTLKSTDHNRVNVGDKIEIKVRLEHPFPPMMVNGFDLQFHAWFHQIGAYGYALRPVQKIKDSELQFYWQAIREKVGAHIGRVLPADSGIIAQILLTGTGSRLSPEIRHDFSAAGLAHLLSIAGLHFGIVMTIVTLVMRWLIVRSEYLALYWPVKGISFLAGWTAGLGYLFLTGAHLPAIRSLIMASLVILALLCRRRAFSMHNLMIAAFAILIGSPDSVLNVSFQMSMVAVMALIAGCRYGPVHLHGWGQRPAFHIKLWRYMIEAGWVSIVAGLAVCPVIMASFNMFNPYFVFANLVAVPLMAFWVLPCGLLSLISMPFGADSYFLHLMGKGICLIVKLAHMIANMPYATINIGYFPGWGLFLYIIGLCILCLCISKLRFAGIIMMITGVLTPMLMSYPDIVTTANGQMIAIRKKHHLWVSCQYGCNHRVIGQWRNLLSISGITYLVPGFKDTDVVCEKFYCHFFKGKGLILFKPFPVTVDMTAICQNVRIELSVLWKQDICHHIMHVNKRSNWTKGAHMIWLDPLTVKTDFSVRGKRPWVMEPIERGAPNLPMAASEQ